MKKTLITLLFLFLMGCDILLVSEEIEISLKFCKSHGGLSDINATQFAGLIVKCMDGSRILLSEINMEK